MSNRTFKKGEGRLGEKTGPVRLPHLRQFAAPARDGEWQEEPTTICGDIRHAAHTEAQRLDVTAGATPDLEAMLGVISYCYAKGLFSSADIEHELWETPAFLAAFGHKLPTASQIKSFRRNNRLLILSVVEHALQEFSCREPRWVREQVIAAEADLTAPAQALAQWLLDMANYSDSLEAE